MSQKSEDVEQDVEVESLMVEHDDAEQLQDENLLYREQGDGSSAQVETLSDDNEEYLQVSTTTFDHYALSEYEKIKLRFVAEREAEMRRLYPTFLEDLRALKVQKPRKQRSKVPVDLVSTRSSNRIRNRTILADSSNQDILHLNKEFDQGDLIVKEGVGKVSNSGDVSLAVSADRNEMVSGDINVAEELEAAESIVCENQEDNESSGATQDEMLVNEEDNESTGAAQNEMLVVAESGNEAVYHMVADEISVSTRGKFVCLPCDRSFR